MALTPEEIDRLHKLRYQLDNSSMEGDDAGGLYSQSPDDPNATHYTPSPREDIQNQVGQLQDKMMQGIPPPGQQPDYTDADKLNRLKFEMNNTSQAHTYPFMPYPFQKSQDSGLAYSPWGPARMDDPNAPMQKAQQIKDLEQERLYRDPQRFNRIKTLLGK